MREDVRPARELRSEVRFGIHVGIQRDSTSGLSCQREGLTALLRWNDVQSHRRGIVMRRVDMHIIRTARGWHLQSARGTLVKVFHDPVAAVEAGQVRMKEWQRRGLDARLVIHRPGKPPEVQDFPADPMPSHPPIQSYALSRCCLC